MKYLVLARRSLLVISVFPLLAAMPFVVLPQLAAKFASLPSPQAMAVQPKDAHRQSASNGRTTQTVWITGGEFSMGSDEPQFPDARPWHRVLVDGFRMDKTLVTNTDYAGFARATGYVTVAERVPNAKDYPGAASPEKLVAGSVVFAPPGTAVPLNNQYQWWDFIKGANWRHP